MKCLNQAEEMNLLMKDLSKKYTNKDPILNIKNYLQFLEKEINKYVIENANFKQAYNILDQAVILLNSNLELLYYNQPAKQLFSLDENSLYEPIAFVLKDLQLKKMILEGKDKDIFEYCIKNEVYEVKLFSSEYQHMPSNHIRAMIIFSNIQANKEIAFHF